MREKMPRTPFSTPLSGSAREAELRLRNIFSGPKKRPPALFLAAVFAVCIFCGNLVSCNVAEAEPNTPLSPGGASSASVSVPPNASQPENPAEGWTPAELKNSIIPDCLVDEPYAGFTQEEAVFLEALIGTGTAAEAVVAELPRQAVDPFGARRQDYWHDMLLPVAYDEGSDTTVYFVVVPDSMTDIEPGASPDLGSLEGRGIVIRWGGLASYLGFAWDINAKFASAPLLCVDDFDGDSSPEAALALAVGEGTGCYVESLYIVELDPGAMSYSTIDYSDLPLEIFTSPDGSTARLSSGEREWKVDLTQLYEPFKGTVEVGNQVSFQKKDGQIICDLGLDFSCMTLEYLAGAHFPIVHEWLPDGGARYTLGPAVWMGDIL